MKDPTRAAGKRPRPAPRYPVTPDGRYFIVRGKLWRRSNPALPEHERARLVSELMRARSAVGHAKRNGDTEAERAARADVDAVKIALGERGPPWWTGDADHNRTLVRNTPYRAWFESLPAVSRRE